MKARDIRENGIRIDVKRGFQITQQHGTMCIVHDGHRYDVDGYDMYMVEKQEPWPAIGSLDWAAQMMLEGESVTRTEWEKSKWYSMSRAFLKMIASHIHGTDSVALSDIGAWKAEMKSQGLTSGWEIYEPQPKIGSLGWAIQRMREGEKIFRPDWADKTARISMVVEDKITWESDALGITIMDMRKWDSRILGEYRNSGWQIYEPKPKYIAGDWVEYVCDINGNRTHARVIEMPTKKHCLAHLESFHEDRIRVEEKAIIRKLKPSEVVLDFGKGIKGKVRKYGESSDMAWIGKHMIFMPDIAEPMRTTVLELLKAQSEDEEC